jgi:hypothetical protein
MAQQSKSKKRKVQMTNNPQGPQTPIKATVQQLLNIALSDLSVAQRLCMKFGLVWNGDIRECHARLHMYLIDEKSMELDDETKVRLDLSNVAQCPAIHPQEIAGQFVAMLDERDRIRAAQTAQAAAANTQGNANANQGNRNPAPLKAKFSGSIQGTTVVATNNSSGGTAPVSYEWEIDGITVGTQKDLRHDTTVGPHNIALIATDANGHTDQMSKNIKVDQPAPANNQASNPPPANQNELKVRMTWQALQGNVVHFDTTTKGGTTPFSYEWKVGGAIISTAKTFDWQAPSNAAVEVVLRVTDRTGVYKQVKQTVNPDVNAAANQTPAAHTNAPASGGNIVTRFFRGADRRLP